MSKLYISSRSPKGFRRCGMEFGPEVTEVPTNKFTPEQIEALKSEPNLVVLEAQPQPASNDGSEKADLAKAQAELEKAKQKNDALEAKVKQLEEQVSTLKEEAKLAKTAAKTAAEADKKSEGKSTSK